MAEVAMAGTTCMLQRQQRVGQTTLPEAQAEEGIWYLGGIDD